jgi:tRNA U34 5-methylaminomethyl-2-thiouridine-forming methyltransferase MnmC
MSSDNARHTHLVHTADGSPSLYSERFGQHYHSMHGAVQESRHVFLEHGLQAQHQRTIRLLEFGFGTGLNAWLTAQLDVLVKYTALEAFPVEMAMAEAYAEQLPDPLLLMDMHRAPWGLPAPLAPHFSLLKLQQDFLSPLPVGPFNVVYFDAFSPEKQPELWTTDMFLRIWQACDTGAVLTTYCAKGQVRRNMVRAGWKVEKLPGPPGKREMLRAWKM